MILLIMSISMLFLFLNHPLSFGLILLIQTILISLITGVMNLNFWFSYILFLIMIGGLLILFIYMTSIASNEKFKFSNKILNFIMLMILFNLTIYFTDSYLFSFNLDNFDLVNQNNFYQNNISMSKFLNWPNNLMIYLMILYLLITLIVVVKITKIKFGPLRQMN
uniref:NADH-ubiquinone oxidoreductase chain 6 n=1 Tax=Cortodera humeralis TaxID=1586472 RepID=A0A343C196_9CUCU|nr:NADH dehydrogenase subunit 6 [Cortodera humeralis]